MAAEPEKAVSEKPAEDKPQSPEQTAVASSDAPVKEGALSVSLPSSVLGF